MSRCLADHEMIEVAELLCLAADLCQAAQDFVSAALGRIAGVEVDLGPLRHDATRLAAVLSRVPTLAEPTTGASR